MNKPRQFHIRREHLLEGSALDVDPPFASLDVVLWRDYEAECSRLREQLDAARQALTAIDEVTGPYDDGYVEEVKKILARAALGVEGPAAGDGQP